MENIIKFIEACNSITGSHYRLKKEFGDGIYCPCMDVYDSKYTV